MKTKKIGLIIVILFILSVPSYFTYTRFCLKQYEMSGNTLIFRNSIYVLKNSLSASDEEGLGKTIGIAIDGKRTITDYIWPFWVIEYKNDKEFKRIFVQGLMGSGGVYEQNSK
jgi:hypothetical protein